MKIKNILKRTLQVIVLVSIISTSLFASKDTFTPNKNYEILLNFFRDVNLYYVDTVDTEKLLMQATGAMTKNLDPYTTFIPEKDMADFEFMTTGKYGGMGAIIRQKGDYVIIAEPYKGFPADKAKLEIGDKILEIDGADAKGYSTEKVSSLLKGEPGTKFTLKVEKAFTGEEKEMKITRERITISGVTFYTLLPDSTAYILLSDFTQDCSEDMKNAFYSLKKQGATSLIIDLRNNGGGLLQEAVKILSMFTPKGTEVVSMRGKTKSVNEVFKTKDDPIDLEIPITVLVNKNSASASEIVSGALQDLDRAVLVGQRTFGKGLVQNTRHLGYNSYLKVTTAKYYIPSGRCIQALDYSHRDQDGRAENVPDSLISEFKTSAGRRVYDGGGVTPDIKIEKDKNSTFSMIVYAKGYIDDFVAEYFKTNPQRVIPQLGYKLSDSEYAEFVSFMADKDVQWESATKKAINTLKKQARDEDFIDIIDEQIKAMESKLSQDKKLSLDINKDELIELIENQIILQKHYRNGVIASSLSSDKEIIKAQEVLKNSKLYNKYLSNTKDPIK
ncbi:MAG: S41 family peptidase [Rikenellaceae bacterium]